MNLVPKPLRQLKEAPVEAVSVAYLALAISLLALSLAFFRTGGAHHGK